MIMVETGDCSQGKMKDYVFFGDKVLKMSIDRDISESLLSSSANHSSKMPQITPAKCHKSL